MKAEKSATSSGAGGQEAKADDKPAPDEGIFASVACSLLMKVLWVARLARPDLLRAMNHLATKVSEWTSTFYSVMHGIMGYMQAALSLRMIGVDW